MTSPATSPTQAPQAPVQQKPVKKKVKVYIDGKEVEFRVSKQDYKEVYDSYKQGMEILMKNHKN